jgi:hypothetical protein
MKSIIKLASIATIALIFNACGGGGSGGGNITSIASGTYNLSQANKNDLAYMGNEERLAYDVYIYLYNYHGQSIRQLYNIASRSESNHISIVRSLVNKYNITPNDLTNLTTTPVASSTTDQSSLPSGKYDIGAIQDLYNALIAKGKNSVKDALEVGCMVEVTDINDLNQKIANAESSGAQDLVDAFNILRDGSYNHYWAFDAGLKNIGVSAGCCGLGDAYCHDEYPKNTHM